MAVLGTSRKAYKELKDLGDKQRLIYSQIKLMQNEQPSAQDVADALGWPINRVTGRISELKEFGFVKTDGTKISKLGTTVTVLCVTDPNDKKLAQVGEAVRWLDD